MGSRLRRLGAIPILATTVLGGPRPAHAAPPVDAPLGATTVALLPPACTTGPIAADAFAAILTAELRGDGVGRVQTGAPAPAPSTEPKPLATIALDVQPCDPATTDVVVTIVDEATSKRVSRRIVLHDVEAAVRPRALALAVAELLRASWLELATPDAPAPNVPPTTAVREAVARQLATLVPPPPQPREDVVAYARARDVSVEATWRASLGGHSALYGGRAAVAVPVRSAFQLRFDLGAMAGTATDALGNVDLGSATGSASLLYSSPRDAAVAAAFGPRMELGAAWASGHAAAQQTSSSFGAGFVWNALLLGAFRLRISPSWRLALELEAGATAVPFLVLADARRVTGIEGAMFGLAFGVAQLR